jgi:transposase InsO family protein
MYQDTYDFFIKGCEKCQENKVSRHPHPAPLQPIAPSERFERLHIDFLGPLPKSNGGFEHILLVVDSFSRWPEAFALKSQEATEVSKVLFQEIFTRWGAPRVLVSDRGKSFMAKLVKALCEIFEVERHYTSSYHPESNATCERTNSTIEQCLRHYVDQNQKNWPDILPSVMMALRASPSSQSTQYSPYYLLYGKEMTFPCDVNMIPKPTLNRSTTQHVEDVLHKLKIANEIATNNIRKAQTKSKTYYDRKAKQPNYKLGDRVYLRNTRRRKGLSPKLSAKWSGPYYVTDVGDNFTYNLRDCKTNQPVTSRMHANRMKIYHDQSEQLLMQQQPTTPNDPLQPHAQKPDTSRAERPAQADTPTPAKSPLPATGDGDKWYEVDRLLKMVRQNGKKYYLIKWKGDYKPTLEPIEHVSPFLVRQFHIHRTQSGHKRKRKRQCLD